MAAQPSLSGPGEHFTISYAGFNRPWAAWIAHRLEGMGHRTALLRWDPGPEAPLTGELSSLLIAPGRVLMVLDDWYFRLGPRTDEEWAEALGEVVSQHADRFAAVSVATRRLPATVSALSPVDLRDLDAREADRRIIRRLGISPRAAGGHGADANAPRFPNDPPEVWNVQRRNDRFTGRDKVLEELRGALADSAGRVGGTRIALHGISGVGKTQVAAEFAHRYGNDYDIVWWMDANYRGTAREQLAELAPRLGLPAGQEIGDRIRAVHEALRLGRPFRRWLLVFDGADDMEQIEDLLPEGRGHVLLTTLTRDWSASGSAHEIEVRSFIRAESVAYARRRAPRLTPAEADQLAEAVQDLPLLLAQTAAWLDANQMSAKEYIELLRRGNPSQLGIRYSSDYPMGFQTSWSITLNTLRERNPAAAELLKLMAFFSPDAVPVGLLATARRGTLPEYLADLATEPIRWHTALRRLSESTAVRLDYQPDSSQDPAVERVQMHRLYHRFLRSDLPEEERETLAKTACDVLVSADPRRPSDTRNWERYADLIQHLDASGAMDSNDPAVRELILNCIEYLRMRNEYRTGLRLCEEASSRWRGRLAPTDSTMLVVRHQHANMLRRAGRYQEAEAAGRAVVDLLATERGEDDPDLLRAKDGLGGSLMALGAYTAAAGIFSEVWQAYSRLLGADAPRTLASRNNLGEIYGLLGQYEKAMKIHREILLVREENLRARNQQTLHSASQYARTLRLTGRYTEAASRLDVIVRRQQQLTGRYGAQTIHNEHQLALCLRRSGDLVAAETMLRSVVERAQQVHGPRHPETLLVQADYANFLREHGDLHEALALAEDVTKRYEALVGPGHPYTIGTRGNVGLVRGELGDSDEALSIAEQTLHGMREAVGEDHPWSLGCAVNVAAARSRMDDTESAADLSRDTLERAKRVLGDSHPLTLSAKTSLADDLRAMRRNQDAAKLEREALQQLSEMFGQQHPHTLAVRRRQRPYWDFEPQPV